jgi:hypothetical protein
MDFKDKIEKHLSAIYADSDTSAIRDIIIQKVVL